MRFRLHRPPQWCIDIQIECGKIANESNFRRDQNDRETLSRRTSFNMKHNPYRILSDGDCIQINNKS